MGLTLIQRSSGRRLPRKPKVALVLAGGAVTGGAFKVGGLKALDECLVGRSVNELDMYVGLSAGAFLATSLAAGITPDEMVGALEGTSPRLSQLRPFDFYRPNVGEFVQRPLRFSADLAAYLPGLVVDLLSVLPELPARVGEQVRQLIDRPTYTRLENLLMQLFDEVSPKREFPSVGALVPSGIFDNSALEKWLASNMATVDAPNRFADLYRQTGRRLFITATNLDSAEQVVFGPENDHGLLISQAVQASSALPGFFRPARFDGVDYVDGGVQRTANIGVAIEHDADLIICYNPFRPYLNQPDEREGDPSHLADRGMRTVLNQVFRTMLHTRLSLGLRSYLNDTRFRGDIVVIEPIEKDAEFFDLNPLAFWKRSEAIQHGFDSVRRTLAEHTEVLEPLFARYGVQLCTDPAPAEPAEAQPEDADASPPLRLLGGFGR
jgi:predicted acylesterase/phospholipase RssA